MDFLKNKNVLIAGGAGLLGTSLTRRLVDIGAKVTSAYFSRPPDSRLADLYKKYDFTKYGECLTATEGQDYVIICAVQASGVSGMTQSPTATILPNLEIHAGLFEACCHNNVEKAVWVSSSTVYPESSCPVKETDLDLNQPTFPLYQGVGGVYRYLEQLAQCYLQQRNFPIGVIRTSNIYGPFDRFDDQKSHVLPALIKRALNKDDPYIVWGNGHTVRDFVYVDDLAEAVFRVLENYCKADPINFSYGSPVTIRQAVQEILIVCNHDIVPQFDTTKPTAIPYRILDNSKFDRLLGTIRRTNLQEDSSKQSIGINLNSRGIKNTSANKLIIQK